MTDPERLPPPPFWRTRYFALDVLVRRPYLDPIEILRILERPQSKRRQSNGRTELFGWSETLGTYLCVVVLSDGETVRNAFTEEGYRP